MHMCCLLVEMDRSCEFGGWPVIMTLQTVSNVLRLLSLHSGAPVTNQMTTPLKSRLGPPVSLRGSLTEHL